MFIERKSTAHQDWSTIFVLIVPVNCFIVVIKCCPSILSWLFHIQAVISKSASLPINEILNCNWISRSNNRVYFDGITGCQRFLQSDKITVRKILRSSSKIYALTKKKFILILFHFERIILTLVFSSVSIGLAFFSSILYGIAYSMTYSFCEKDENNDDFEHALILPSGISENFLFSFEFIFVWNLTNEFLFENQQWLVMTSKSKPMSYCLKESPS